MINAPSPKYKKEKPISRFNAVIQSISILRGKFTDWSKTLLQAPPEVNEFGRTKEQEKECARILSELGNRHNDPLISFKAAKELMEYNGIYLARTLCSIAKRSCEEHGRTNDTLYKEICGLGKELKID